MGTGHYFKNSKKHFLLSALIAPVILCFQFSVVKSQYLEEFESPAAGQEIEIPEGWGYATGDGQASMQFLKSEGYASIIVDATRDKLNIWWALVRVQVSGLDLEKLMGPDYELRVEARIRTSHAPRRVNLHFNHQRTTDFHSHLMEYDIPKAWTWHTISMTTRNFEVQEGDRVNAQMALMDWGTQVYRVDIDYFKVDVVKVTDTGSDLGEPQAYHPPLEDPRSYALHPAVIHDAIVDSKFQDLNFNNWRSGNAENNQLLAAGGSQIIILRWDLEEYKGRKVSKGGMLELITHSLQRSPEYQKDFGMIRICEIIGGDPSWEQETVTYERWRRSRPIENVINTQMIIDSEVNPLEGGSSLFTISRPVLQRLIDGETLGIAIKPLGAVNATFKSMDYDDGQYSPKLHFNLE